MIITTAEESPSKPIPQAGPIVEFSIEGNYMIRADVAGLCHAATLERIRFYGTLMARGAYNCSGLLNSALTCPEIAADGRLALSTPQATAALSGLIIACEATEDTYDRPTEETDPTPELCVALSEALVEHNPQSRD